MSRKSAETTIRTSIRIRPCSEKEKETYPGPSLVQAGQGEVRLYAKPALSTLNLCNNRTGGGARCVRRHSPSAACMHSRLCGYNTAFSVAGCSMQHHVMSGCAERVPQPWVLRHCRDTGPGKRPGTPTSRPGTPNAAASEAAQAVWRAVAMQQLGDYQSYPFGEQAEQQQQQL